MTDRTPARLEPVRVEETRAAKTVALRSFANEDIFFYVKRIDNSGVVRVADPASRGIAWKMIGTVGAAALLIVGILLPGAYGLMAGYEIQSLREQGARLEAEQAALDVEQAKVMTPARMQELVQEQQFTDPSLQKTVYLPFSDRTGDGSALAANQAPESGNVAAAGR